MVGINEALNLLSQNISPRLDTKKVEINFSLNEILSSDIIAKKNLPSFDNSALDGYAYAYDERDEILSINDDVIFAGDKKERKLRPKQSYKIMTGAPIPNGCDSILRLEDATFENGNLKIPQNARAYDGVRKRGEDVKKGEILLKKGEILDSQKIMLLASQGINEIEIIKKPKIAIFSSGNELKEPWQNADESEIYNANAAAFIALLQNFGFKSSYLGIIRDEFKTTVNTLNSACENFDIIITSGGASVGEADFMRRALEELGFSEIFGYIDIKPGRPIKCFKKNEKLVFVIPGNPMAAFILFKIIVIPAIFKVCSANDDEIFANEFFYAKFKGNLKFKNKRQNLLLGTYKNGEFYPLQNGKFSSAAIKPLVIASHFCISEISCETLNDGDIVKIYKI